MVCWRSFVFGLALLAGCEPPWSSSQPRIVADLADSSPESQGLRSDRLAAALELVVARRLDVHGLTIARHGAVVLDATFGPFPAGARHDVASVTKSVTSMLVGIAIGDGVLRLDQPIRGRASVRIRDLLMMSSDLECGGDGEPELARMIEAKDWVHFARLLPARTTPGTFRYCSPGFHLLSAELTAATGRSARDFAIQRLFGPLGIDDVYWPADPQGITHGWGDLQLTQRALVKLGQLYLQHGRWSGRPIVPTWWVEQSLTRQIATPGDEDYGYGWWIAKQGPSVRLAIGRGGQRILIWPDKDLAIAVTAGDFDLGNIAPELIEAVASDGPLPPDPEGLARLRRALDAARAPRSASAADRWPAAIPLDHTYRLAANPFGLSALRLARVDDRTAHIELTVHQRRLAGVVGLDDRYRIAADPDSGAPTAAQGRWVGERRLAIDWLLYAIAEHLTLDLAWRDDGTLELTLHEPTHIAALTIIGTQ
jgi:CubicO group peptidase (beta-lactamase class C family)